MESNQISENFLSLQEVSTILDPSVKPPGDPPQSDAAGGDPPEDPQQSDAGCGDSGLPEPPEDPPQSDATGGASGLLEPPGDPPQSDAAGGASCLPEPPEDPPQSDAAGGTSGLPEPPGDPPQSDATGGDPQVLLDPPEDPPQNDATGGDPPGLPEPPEEPLQSDCCGTGCSPCVFDIYQEDLKRWKELASLTPEERAARLTTPLGVGPTGRVGRRGALSLEYKPFQVSAIQQISTDSYIFTFGLPMDCILGIEVGQHVVLRVKQEDGRELTRQYTPISEQDKTGSFDVLIKLYPNGRMSRHIKQWKIGSTADWRGPYGTFDYSPNKFHRIGMLACGTGIAPMVQVARAIVESDIEDTIIHCLYACRTQHDILLKQQLNHFRSFWNFTVTYVLSATPPGSLSSDPGKVGYGDKVRHGHVDKELVGEEMAAILPGACSKESIVLICGTKSFDKDMINILHKHGCTEGSYFKF